MSIDLGWLRVCAPLCCLVYDTHMMRQFEVHSATRLLYYHARPMVRCHALLVPHCVCAVG